MVSVHTVIDSHFPHERHPTFTASKTFVGVGDDREEAINDALIQAAERFPNAAYRVIADIFDLGDAPATRLKAETRASVNPRKPGATPAIGSLAGAST